MGSSGEPPPDAVLRAHPLPAAKTRLSRKDSSGLCAPFSAYWIRLTSQYLPYAVLCTGCDVGEVRAG